MTATPRRTRRAAQPAAALPSLPDDFAVRVIAWQQRHGRHHLPWQNTGDAYRTWLSEIMLQQTQVSAVLGYYARFIERFPTVQALAAAPADDVMAAWAGLGYYTRARNLHRCAQIVVAEYGGIFPRDPDVLATLPGIGRSTAAAIAAFSYGVRAAILDGNVKRVFARVFGIDGFPGDKRVEDTMWRIAETVLPPAEGIQPYTQGLMDLGATVCTRGKPACLTGERACPLESLCEARSTDRVMELPVPRPRKAIPERAATLVIALHADAVLLQRRPQRGIWGGLWSLPLVGEMDDALDEHPLDVGTVRRAAQVYGAVSTVEMAGALTHTFTHFRLQMHLLRAEIGTPAELDDDWRWVPLAQLNSVGLPAPVKLALETLVQPSLI
ncbi:A/G-specific adenine glycosylase [Ralstonia mojiangensis]|uniref:A/G-specific adenine glycosylase n=1 Tax=Ralstonia mojiangensis TaxID=2953895 RepID=UPI0020914E5F|nr:A/G-specific adenine glycosylase [Ralstonia mojiangensis]MCO5411646.1 A/G-specific adenine glycosylase [Ralstonia mojiangensis]